VIDWSKVTNNLRQRRVSLAKIARETGADPVTLQRLARGEIHEPRFSVGIRLLDLHKDVCPERHHQLRT
jgi:transcriptional regulator with XRE-family HTH domain